MEDNKTNDLQEDEQLQQEVDPQENDLQQDEQLQQEVVPQENDPNPEQPAEENKKEKKPIGKEIMEWILTILAAVAIALVIRTFIFEPVRVDGRSMEDTLADGEIMFVSKLGYASFDFIGGRVSVFGNPKRFDVVICRYPDRGTTSFVKRVVGLPGDTVKIEDGYLYVNGEKYDEPYINDSFRTGMGSHFSEYVVPEGKYFVMGDHRNNSNDSRYIGPLDRNMIVGHVVQILFPFSAFRSIPNGLDVAAK